MKKWLKKAGSWLSTLWYCRKWEILIGSFFVIVLTICIVQFFHKSEPDAIILYGGPVEASPSEWQGMMEAFSYVLPQDYNGDGVRDISIMNFFLVTDEQYQKIMESASVAEKTYTFTPQYISQERTNYTNALMASEAVIYLVDQKEYENLRKQAVLLPLSEALGEENVPTYAQDSYGIRFADTPFAQYFNIFSILPEDTILCVRALTTQTLFYKEDQESEHRKQQYEFLKGILSFEFPEGFVPDSVSSGEANHDSTEA